MGGMYSDRMPITIHPTPAPEPAPRAPRAMVPRDSNAYQSGLPTLSPTSPYSPRSVGPPVVEPPGPLSLPIRMRPGLPPPMSERHWEPNGSRLRDSFSGPGPSPVDPPPVGLPSRLINDMGRNLPERPVSRMPVSQHEAGRGPPPPRSTGTNSIPIGPRTSVPEGTALHPDPPTSFRPPNNGYDSYRPSQNADRQSVDRASEPSPAYTKRVRQLSVLGRRLMLTGM
ncbi:hypothetical protein BD309DRAFT_873973 [Dichomitus squalens]|uniref:Uncharacterized protein n=2 Tax=Dichomitus squalens TaxID=114155 RepID=A0A4Q9NG84_9APHY|nr:uncharacterized protein DICSQDRAFT_141183 [Dichomitus squalens LYAD-421 SS1]EJF56564.1 hypothetical protein DICSQDRAFT_141183 [Dichomitus squalens LYAD-421 SS1]TBU29463.1 hypothetical protein BD311DRAFT_777587 [Dichomitus squalens]TBU38622.1 hypothetical protein BD309DRAFT_873973 [Dichomitus squalens]